MKREYGGCILPRPVRSVEDPSDRHRRTPAIFWGRLVSKPQAKEVSPNKHPRTEYTFLLAISKKKFQRCDIDTRNPFGALVPGWNVGDQFCFLGEYEEYEYEATEPEIREVWDKKRGKKVKKKFWDKDGKKVEKTAYDFHVQFVIPGKLIIDPARYMETFMREADPMFSASMHDYVDYSADDEIPPMHDDLEAPYAPERWGGHDGERMDWGEGG